VCYARRPLPGSAARCGSICPAGSRQSSDGLSRAVSGPASSDNSFNRNSSLIPLHIGASYGGSRLAQTGQRVNVQIRMGYWHPTANTIAKWCAATPTVARRSSGPPGLRRPPRRRRLPPAIARPGHNLPAPAKLTMSRRSVLGPHFNESRACLARGRSMGGVGLSRTLPSTRR
jgi:hypothetical protein